jgi:hypothetical protein
VADHAAVLVGVGAQGHVLVLAGDQVEDLHAIPARPQLLVAEHPHLHVGADAAVVAQRQPGLAGEGGVGPDPEAEYHHVGGHGPAGDLDRPDRPSRSVSKPVTAVSVWTSMPSFSIASCTSSPISGSSVLMGWGAWSTTVTTTCRRARASAISTPM